MATPATNASAGDIVSPAERFTGWELIGNGGVGDVFKVHDRDLGVYLAVKILKQVHREDRRYVDSLRGEVLISRKLRHPNICPIHDLYEGPKGVGIIMDLILGQDLKGWMREHRGRLLDTIDERLTVLRKLTEALAVAHSEITHRDLKPANIFIKGNDISAPVIMDFGLSLVFADETGHGLNGGTPKYMAPEQLISPASVDKRADLFALGIIAYELLTDGEIPVCSLKDAGKSGTLPKFSAGELLPPSTFCSALPPELDRLILQMLDYDPDRRPQTAQEIRDVLGSVKLRDALAPPQFKELGRPPCVLVAANTYTIGDGSIGARVCDQPQKRIRFSAYYMASTPVTNGQYREFLKATGYKAPLLIDHPRFKDHVLPVVMVSWDDAMAYAKWAGGRLPSELEWEVAARAGIAENHYPWGESLPRNTQANIDGLLPGPTPVKSYPTGANAWDLYDFCGNVWEWCADVWDASLLKNLNADAQAIVTAGGSQNRSIRGGSFESPAMTGRCSFRHFAPRNEARADLGFRLVFEA